MKAAYQTAAGATATGPLLNRLFHSALAAGKRVSAETGIGEGAVSVSYAALSLARKIFGELSGLSALVLGAGEMAKLTATHLQSQHVRELVVVEPQDAVGGRARRPGRDGGPLRGSNRARSRGGRHRGDGDRRHGTCADARSRAGRHAHRGGIARCSSSISRCRATWRPAAGELEQVFLYNIDDLQSIVSESLDAAHASDGTGGRDRRRRGREFVVWLRSRHAVPTVVALRQQFEDIRRAELKRLEPKLAGLGPEARARVDDVTRLIVEKLLLDADGALEVGARPAHDRRLGRRAGSAVQRCRPAEREEKERWLSAMP